MLAPVPLPVVFEREINCVVETMPGDEWERRNLREGHELHEVLEAAVLLMAHLHANETSGELLLLLLLLVLLLLLLLLLSTPSSSSIIVLLLLLLVVMEGATSFACSWGLFFGKREEEEEEVDDDKLETSWYCALVCIANAEDAPSDAALSMSCALNAFEARQLSKNV